MQLDARTIVILKRNKTDEVLLLKRSSQKKLFPNLITGIGGKVELEKGEDNDLEAAAIRELHEETGLLATDLSDCRLRLTTLETRGDQLVVLLWLTATLKVELSTFEATEGMVGWYRPEDLPLAEMIPSASLAIPFVLGLPDNDQQIYTGLIEAGQTLITWPKGKYAD